MSSTEFITVFLRLDFPHPNPTTHPGIAVKLDYYALTNQAKPSHPKSQPYPYNAMPHLTTPRIHPRITKCTEFTKKVTNKAFRPILTVSCVREGLKSNMVYKTMLLQSIERNLSVPFARELF